MKALRLPAAHTQSLMDSVLGPMCASNVRARRSAPVERGGRSAGLGCWVSRHTHSGVLRSWTRAGDHRFPGDPSYAFALLHDPGRAGRTSPLVVLPMPPPASKHRRPQRKIISRLTQGFSIRCLRFKSSVAAAPARLASGWRAAPLPGGRRTLWTAAKSFRSCHLPPFQDFACRNQILSALMIVLTHHATRPSVASGTTPTSFEAQISAC